MSRFKKILFVHREQAGSDDALSGATELAQHNAAQSTIIEVAKDELNVTIPDFATSLAPTENSEVHIVHAWNFAGADSDTMRSETTAEIRERLFKKNGSVHRAWLQSLLDGYELSEIDHHVHFLHGPVEPTLTNFVNDNQIDLVAMGTLRRTGIPGFLIGSTAEYVLGRVNCSALTKKQSGFQTPVTLDAMG